MPAKFSLDHVMKQGSLRTMLEWQIEIDRAQADGSGA
jgi:hypothetical protein